MRKLNLLIKSLFLLCALIVGSSAWANEVTFSYQDYKGHGTSNTGSEYTMVKPDVSITETKFYCSETNNYAQFYANGTTTITPGAGVTITQIVLTATAAGNNGYQSSGKVEPSTGSCSANGAIVTWTGSANAAFTISHNKQIRWTSIVVTYTGGQTQPCETPTFSIAAGPVLSGTKIALSSSTNGATIYYTKGATPADPTTSSTEYTVPIEITEATTIKAIAVKEGNSNSAVASAAYTILSAPIPNPTGVNSNYYTLVTDASTLADGDAIIIVSGSKALGTTQNQNNRAAADVVVANNAINEPGADVQKLVLAKSGNYYFFYTGEDGYLYAASSSSNHLKTEETADMNAAATINISGENSEATIKFNGQYTRNNMRCNSDIFSCYATGASTGTAVQIYKEVTKPADAKSAAEFSFPKSAYYIAYDVESFSKPTLSTAAGYDGTVVYSSSDTNVATVNPSTGAVTIVGAGTTVITASATATSKFYEDEASYTLNVYEVADGVFDIKKGNYGSGAEPGTASNSTLTTTWTAGNVTMVVAGRNIWYNGLDLRLYKNDAEEGSPSSAGNITISVPNGYFITKINGTKALVANVGNKNSTTWTGKSQSVKFTNEGSNTVTLDSITVYYSTPTINVTMDDAGYMTYCNQNAALSFGDLEAYVVSAVGESSVTLAQITNAPANTPVILKGTPGNHTLTVEASADAVETNKLYRSNGTAKNTESRDVYALAKKEKGVGFYKLGDDVTVPAGKCYISVSKSVQTPTSREFLSIGDDATAIKAVEGVTERGVVYDLQGRRVAQPTRGLYIEKGKKVIIK